MWTIARAALAFILVALVMSVLSADSGSASHSIPVTVTITRITNLGDEGIEDNLRGEADLYACVFIFADGLSADDCTFDIHVDDDDDVEPFVTNPAGAALTFNVPGELSNVDIVIEVWDHDGCDFPRCFFDPDILGESDDLGDADPGAGGNVDLNLDLATGVWSGDTTGSCLAEDPADTDSAVRVCWDISTLSASGDADNDGLLDSWESFGFDSNGDGTIDVDLPGFGADPLHKDLFVEFDAMIGQEPNAAAIQAMKTAFAAAPINAGQGGISNPDGLPGINLWMDTGNIRDSAASEDGAGVNSCNDGLDNGPDGNADGADADCPLAGDNLGGGNTFAAFSACLDAGFYGAKAANFDNANRRWIFRYAISGAGDGNPSGGCNGGQGEIGGNDFIEHNHDGGTIMHELGHNLNLRHGGNENKNCKPNYVSVMDYDEQFAINQVGGGSIIDYSPPRTAAGRGVAPLQTLVENNLNEGIQLDATDASNMFVFTDGNGNKVNAPLNQPVDWNGDGDTADNPVTVNTDTNATGGGPAACTNGGNGDTQTGFNDWNVVALSFRPFGDSADGAINPEEDPLPTLQELLDQQELLNTTDLSITKSASPNPVVAGEQIFYQITVTNNGPNPANNVQVVDTLPVGLVYVTDTDSCVEGPPGTLTCDLGGIPANDSETFTIVASVPADYVVNGGAAGITNTATVENVDGNDSDPGNNEASASTIVIERADLRVIKECKPDEPMAAGATGTCTIFVDNLGPSDARNVILTDAHVSNGEFTILSASANPGGACLVADGIVTCDLGTEPAGGRTTIVVTLTATEPQDINDCASVSSPTPDPNTGNNHSCDGINVFGVADLSIDKSDSPDPLNAGTQITYTLDITNSGPSTAVNVVVRDFLPAGVSIVSVNGTGGASCVFGVPGDNLRPTKCNFDSIAAGASETMTIVVSVNPGVLRVAHNDAKVSSATFDPNNANNVDSEDTTIQVADIQITKTSAADINNPSKEVIYTLTIFNNGPADAHNVVVTDDLPLQKQDRVFWLPGGTTCTKPAGGTLLTCNLGTVPAGGTRTINIAIVFKGNRGVVSNTADVTTTTFDPDLSNNSSTKLVLVGQPPKP